MRLVSAVCCASFLVLAALALLALPVVHFTPALVSLLAYLSSRRGASESIRVLSRVDVEPDNLATSVGA